MPRAVICKALLPVTDGPRNSNLSFGRLIDAGDQVEDSGFACAVGTDQADEFAARE